MNEAAKKVETPFLQFVTTENGGFLSHVPSSKYGTVQKTW